MKIQLKKAVKVKITLKPEVAKAYSSLIKSHKISEHVNELAMREINPKPKEQSIEWDSNVEEQFNEVIEECKANRHFGEDSKRVKYLMKWKHFYSTGTSLQMERALEYLSETIEMIKEFQFRDEKPKRDHEHRKLMEEIEVLDATDIIPYFKEDSELRDFVESLKKQLNPANKRDAERIKKLKEIDEKSEAEETDDDESEASQVQAFETGKEQDG